MSTTTEVRRMTSDELFALPYSSQVDRWLIRGVLHEAKGSRRNPSHSGVAGNIATFLGVWLKAQPSPKGRLYIGNAYFRLRKDPDTNVGIDVAISTATQVKPLSDEGYFLEGPPLLAVEVLSPSDRQRQINAKNKEYLACGVSLLWLVNPVDQTAIIYRPGHPPEMVNNTMDLCGDPVLPGFSCRVADLFS